MFSRLGGRVILAPVFLFVLMAFLSPTGSYSAPYAAMVMDARTGEVLHSRNADTRLHPASLTKMMTLYIAFEAVERGEIDLDTLVTITAHAANEPPSRLGLGTGQQIAFRYLIRAAAIKSANDAATAIGIAISGSEAAFARRMNRTAEAMGLTRTTFRNAHGLTEEGHLSTARDMTILGRHMIYDYPEYYNLFSRRSTDAGIRTVNNTNTRLLDAYSGADGIKTGYTRAAGFNLVASAERGTVRVIATVFGGRSTATRNARVAELLDMGFERAPLRATTRPPALPNYGPGGPASDRAFTVSAVLANLRPPSRPSGFATFRAIVIESDDIQQAVELATAAALADAVTDAPAPAPSETDGQIVQVAEAAVPAPADPLPEIITRLSTSGGHHWGINVGQFPTRFEAERVLLQIALSEMTTLDGGLRNIVQTSGGFDANFVGLTQETADLACQRLQARGTACTTVGPS